MAIVDFLIENYVLLIMLTGMFIMTLFDVYLERSMIKKLRIVIGLILALSVFDALESYTGYLEHFTYWRLVFSVICYSLRPTIIMVLILIICPKISRLIAIPAVINFLVSFSAFFSGISFSFEKDINHFVRGPLGYTPYIVTIVYILITYYITVRTLTVQFSEEGMIVLFIALTATGSAFLALKIHEEVVNLTYAADVLLYYMYLYAQYTKNDPLTHVYNRQTLRGDLKKRPKNITGIISIDMNDLKWLNDNFGHDEGDKALKAIANCFSEAATIKERIYRIGGDEFVIMCRDRSESEIKQLEDTIRKAVTDTGYSCAFGYSFGKSIDKMIEESDDLMYKDKARIKKELKEKGIEHIRKDV